MLFGIIIGIILIIWFVQNIHDLSSKSSIVSFIINLILLLTILGLIFKAIKINIPSNSTRVNSFTNLVFNIIYYIPCLFTNLFENINDPNQENHWNMLVFAIVLYIIYFTYPLIIQKFLLCFYGKFFK